MKSKNDAELDMSETPTELEGTEPKKYHEHELQSMVETLKKAHHIKNDKHAMNALKPHLKKEKMAIDALTGNTSDGVDPKAGVDGLRQYINKKGKA